MFVAQQIQRRTNIFRCLTNMHSEINKLWKILIQSQRQAKVRPMAWISVIACGEMNVYTFGLGNEQIWSRTLNVCGCTKHRMISFSFFALLISLFIFTHANTNDNRNDALVVLLQCLTVLCSAQICKSFVQYIEESINIEQCAIECRMS